MKAVKMAAINPNQTTSNSVKFGAYYKSTKSSTFPLGVVIRRSIDLDNTLKQITDRLDKNKPFISASEICDIPLIPKDVAPVTINPAMQAHATTGFTPSTPLGSFDGLLATFWGKHNYTGDNLLEKPYALIYPRLTTRSNSYMVHVRVQTLPPNGRSDSYIIKASQTQPTGEFRGSFLIERYLDPNKAGLVDASGASVIAPTNGDTKGLALGPYRFRVVSSKQFAP